MQQRKATSLQIGETKKKQPSIPSFAGLDCAAWVYDMTKPFEPYSNRGQHPYGEGIDRYLSLEDLNKYKEIGFKACLRMYFVNLMNPHFFWDSGIA